MTPYYENSNGKLFCENCLEIMPTLPDKSVDMILCDLPYGTTACKWDTVIPFEPLWVQYKRLIKDNGAIVLTASQPFTSMLVMSNLKMFRYSLVWEKQKGTDPLNANWKPLKAHEDILLFYNKKPVYNPQKTLGTPYLRKGNCRVKSEINRKTEDIFDRGSSSGERYPKSVLKFTSEGMNANNLHPTQKPVALFEYLVRTYTNEGDTVLDNCAGSGTTGIACMKTNRKFIMIEKELEYVEVIVSRIEAENKQYKMF